MNTRLEGKAPWRALVLMCGLCWTGFPVASSAQDPQDPYAPKSAAPEGCQLVEGDILVAAAPAGAFTAAATFGGCDYWPDGVVPYEWDGNVSAENQQRMRQAMDVCESVANVRFRPKEWWEPFWIHIQNSTGNSSPVGRKPWPNNTVNITSWGTRYVMVHELMHTLGFWHEQSRSDRGTFIQINSQNIQSGKDYNFDMHDEASHYGPYDFDSVMHYDELAFSANGNPTITVLPPWRADIGQREHLSEWDARVLSFLYPYADWRFVNGAYAGQSESGTFIQPYRRFAGGASGVPRGGTVWIQPGVYAAASTYSKPMTLRAPLGGVTLR